MVGSWRDLTVTTAEGLAVDARSLVTEAGAQGLPLRMSRAMSASIRNGGTTARCNPKLACATPRHGGARLAREPLDTAWDSFAMVWWRA